jgi:hypothetical protein
MEDPSHDFIPNTIYVGYSFFPVADIFTSGYPLKVNLIMALSRLVPKGSTFRSGI